MTGGFASTVLGGVGKIGQGLSTPDRIALRTLRAGNDGRHVRYAEAERVGWGAWYSMLFLWPSRASLTSRFLLSSSVIVWVLMWDLSCGAVSCCHSMPLVFEQRSVVFVIFAARVPNVFFFIFNPWVVVDNASLCSIIQQSFRHRSRLLISGEMHVQIPLRHMIGTFTPR